MPAKPKRRPRSKPRTVSRRPVARKRPPTHIGNRIDDAVPLDCLSLHEVARQLRMSVKSASRRIAAGDFPPHIKLGRLTLFRRQAVTEWLRSRESATGIAPTKRTRKGGAR
jgi:predicted DNA-binding transcriptional regulator AlpA